MILLLLVVVAQFPLSLRRHPTLRLSHLVGIVRPWRVALARVVTLDIRRRLGAHAVVFAHRVVSLRTAHAGVYLGQMSHCSIRACVHTVFGVGARAHDRQRVTAPAHGEPEALSALGEVLGSALDFCKRGLARLPGVVHRNAFVCW
jgi:hypothetical protein